MPALYLTTPLHLFPTVPIPGVNVPWGSATERREFERTEDPTRIPIPEVTLAARTPCPIPNATLAAFTSIPIPEEPLADRTTPPIPEVPPIRLIQEFAKSYSALMRWAKILRSLSQELKIFAEDHPELGISPDDVPHQQGFGRMLRKRLKGGRIPGVMLEEKRRIGKWRGWHLYST